MSGASVGRRRVPGEAGVWVFIAGDLVVFALFFGIIVHTRGQDTAGFDASQAHLHRALGALNTIVLLTSSLLVARGVRAADGRGSGDAARLFRIAAVCGGLFMAIKVSEYASLVAGGHTPSDSDFLLYYFVFTAIHFFHVILGTTFLAVIGRRLAATPAPGAADVAFAEVGASFWHLVDLLWVVLFSLLYLMG